MDKDLPYHFTCAVLQPHKDLDEGLELGPSLISYNFKDNRQVGVAIFNQFTRTVTMFSRALLREVQPVIVESADCNADQHHQRATAEQSYLSQIEIVTEKMTS